MSNISKKSFVLGLILIIIMILLVGGFIHQTTPKRYCEESFRVEKLEFRSYCPGYHFSCVSFPVDIPDGTVEMLCENGVRNIYGTGYLESIIIDDETRYCLVKIKEETCEIR